MHETVHGLSLLLESDFIILSNKFQHAEKRILM